jgi:Domain of unknown function (DUF4824)
MNRKLRIATWAGLALVLATNAVALGGAAYNRMGEPQGTLRLTDRELGLPYARNTASENSGLALRLIWRSLPAPRPQRLGGQFYYNQNGFDPQWLDVRKMGTLGFDAKTLARLNRARFGERPTEPPARDVFIVLELDGPAYRESLRRAQELADAAQAQNPSSEAAREAKSALEQDRNDSRLFAVDAGLDLAALRARYPDRSMYAIAHGRVRAVSRETDADRAGAIDALSNGEVNVPLSLRATFDGLTPTYNARRTNADGHFDATLAFGARCEPWLVSAARR